MRGRGLVPTGATFNALVSAVANGKEWLARMEWALLEMGEAGVEATASTYNPAINACAKRKASRIPTRN
eukprot:977114-Prorocentrum_minimum.AAC.3